MPTTLPKVTTTDGIEDPYVIRILSNILNRNVFEVLEESPKAIKRATRGLSEAQLRKAPGKGKWSIAQIINHLCDAELAMSFRLRMAVAETGRQLPRWDENLWAEHLGYEKADTQERLLLYETLRRDTVTFLRGLKKNDLEKFGMHEERGHESVARMAHLIAGHDVNHVKRIVEIRAILLKK